MKRANHCLTALVGILLIAVGLVLLKRFAEPDGILLALPYVCVGVGCGAFGHGVGNIIGIRALKNSPARQKQMEIDQHDERNVLISNRAKGKAYDLMVFVFGALMVSFAMMGVELVVILLMVCAYLFVVGYGVYYRCKYEKEM